MPDLQQWLDFAPQLDAVYQRELGRSAFSDPQAFVNWAFHGLQEGQSLAWITDRIRESEEWQALHGSGSRPTPDAPEPTPDPPVAVPVGPTPVPVPPPPSSGGGFMEHASSTAVRLRLSRAEMQRFVPDRGAFMFPAPYHTRGVRVTNASDGHVRAVGMSYWPNLNNSTGRAELLVLASCDDVLALFVIDKVTGAVRKSGPLPFQSTGEGCYFSFSDPDVLYVPQPSGLVRYHVARQSAELVVAEAAGSTKQFHSSADGRVHSGTLDGHAAVWRDGLRMPFPTPAGQEYDECQIDKSGRWLLIKEGPRQIVADNRIVDLQTGAQWTISNERGAVGHSDMGFGYMVGEDDQANPGGVFRRWDFTPFGPADGGAVYHTDWTAMTRYVSHCNAQPGRPEAQRVLYSSAHNGDVPRANEIVLGTLDGSLNVRVICPNLTDVSTPVDPDTDYWRKTRANLDPTGTWFCWSGNLGTDRNDLFVGQL